MVQLLLKCGAKLLLEDPSGEMCDYASKGDDDNLLLLLNNGIDPNAKDYDSRSALHLAAAEGKDKIVELLLQFKADVNIKDRWGGTPLLDAIVGAIPLWPRPCELGEAKCQTELMQNTCAMQRP